MGKFSIRRPSSATSAWRRSAFCAGLLAGIVGLCISQPAAAYYIGPSYLKVPGIKGAAKSKAHKGWVRAEASYWGDRPGLREIRGISGKESGLKFSGPMTPANGPSSLSLAIDKANPALPGLMALCRAGSAVKELVFAESSEMERHPQEHGPRPADVPEFYEYALRNVRLTCPVVADAPEQAFGLHFEAIEWLNYKPQPEPRPLTTVAANLPAAPRSGQTRAFVVSWFAPVADANANQCPQMNRKPTQAEYYALMSPERAAQQHAALSGKGGANTTVLPFRGPDEMNVTMLPGIVADPGFVSPVADVVRGFDLDGDDGSGPAPSRTRAHRNFTSPDGRKGIDNQLFVIQGCIEGWRRNGFLPMIGNELRRAGGLSILVEISGIDNDQNDNDVAVTILYSADPMRRDGTSKTVLPDYTFRANEDPEFTQDFARFKARIVNGVVITDKLERIVMHEGPATTWSLHSARMRIEFGKNGEMSATLGGYRDWREYLAAAFFRSSDYENTIGFNTTAMYNAVRRAADGLKDPATGEFEGLSAAYEMEGVPAFLPPEQEARLAAGGRFTSREHLATNP
ncbi:Hcp family type VI secretion system effector [Novosphingobium clariflavum]|uniref:Uncharacterized protein n=1 Tax=Novosphingobium clariflavum TaxID=2029884 RepID=A0ABV6S6I0_9SPHN|nr:hypothetical protein [Novosphingobium clariflavum]